MTAKPAAAPDEVVEIRNTLLSALLWPKLGGTVAAFRLETEDGPVDLMRAATPAAIATSDARETACFPLFPFSNRVSGGVFEFRGRRVALSPNMLPHPNPLHGQGWRSTWQVGNRADSFAELFLEYDAGEWPWAYTALQRFDLVHGRLDVSLSLLNRSESVMPCGIGIHPYFPRTNDVRFTAALPTVWLGRGESNGQYEAAVPEAWNFEGGRLLAELELDHCFSGWNGAARLDWPSRGVSVEISASSNLDKLVLFTPAGQDYVCVEPASNASDAFLLDAQGVAGTGTVLLEPGERCMGRVSFAAARF
jgi:aldose 1-epimerase